ncbi:hypothetical protein GGE39_004725 [Rhizobium leguminosarum]|jgi:hypothetical protein|nr:hypothetical protein [Rhizobium leguminosarum]
MVLKTPRWLALLISKLQAELSASTEKLIGRSDGILSRYVLASRAGVSPEVVIA